MFSAFSLLLNSLYEVLELPLLELPLLEQSGIIADITTKQKQVIIISFIVFVFTVRLLPQFLLGEECDTSQSREHQCRWLRP